MLQQIELRKGEVLWPFLLVVGHFPVFQFLQELQRYCTWNSYRNRIFADAKSTSDVTSSTLPRNNVKPTYRLWTRTENGSQQKTLENKMCPKYIRGLRQGPEFWPSGNCRPSSKGSVSSVFWDFDIFFYEKWGESEPRLPDKNCTRNLKLNNQAKRAADKSYLLATHYQYKHT